jgi:hypothetical protein
MKKVHKAIKYVGPTDGIPRVESRVENHAGDDARVTASPGGISIKGPLIIINPTEMDTFARLVANTWKEHLKMKPNLMASISGH